MSRKSTPETDVAPRPTSRDLDGPRREPVPRGEGAPDADLRPFGAPDEPAGAPLIKVGISACLLGRKVRYDGGHKHSGFITQILGDHFRFTPVCPELEVGMGVPRDTLSLQGDPEDPRLIVTKTGEDWTARMKKWSRERLRGLADQDLCGFLLKKDSPSCGMERVKVTSDKGMPEKKGVGVFAAALLAAFPHLPIEEEGRLNDPALRENFIERVFAYRRVKDLFAGRWSRGAVVAFHAAHKYQILAHSPGHYKSMGQLVAAVKKIKPAEFRDRYTAALMEALAVKATVRKNVNVQQHIMGYLKDVLGEAERADLRAVIEDYRAGLVPLVVPVTLLRHHVAVRGEDVRGVEWVRDQTYLRPHPKELMLRNHG